MLKNRKFSVVIYFGVATLVIYAIDMLMNSGGRMGWSALLYAVPLAIFHAVAVEIEISKNRILRAMQWTVIMLLGAAAFATLGFKLGCIISLFLVAYTWTLHAILREVLKDNVKRDT